MLITELRSGEHFLTETYASQRHGLPKEIYNLKNLNMKTSLKLKIKPVCEYLVLIIYLIKQLGGLFFLIKSHF
jgi:hypothetical protein